jgi:phytoene/squalene synthetase
MIHLQQFQQISPQEQKKYLVSLIGDIETTTNQELLLCQRLLLSIDEPSSKTLQYIFGIIAGQLQEFQGQENEKQQHKVKDLLDHIHQQEEIDKEEINTLLEGMDFDV